MKIYLFKIDHRHPALAGHFPGRPIVPAVLILDHILEWLSTEQIEINTVNHLKFLAPVKPEDEIRVEYEPEKYHLRAFVAETLILNGTLK